MGHYITGTDIEGRYHVNNVLMWADPGSASDPTDIAPRIDLGIAYAEDYFDSRMRKSGMSFNLPIVDSDGNVPLLVKDICVKVAGYWLSTCHGVRDYSEKDQQPLTRLYVDHLDAEKKIAQIISGDLILNTP